MSRLGVTRTVALAQAFALVGTLVGVFTTVVAVRPRTVPTVAYHVATVALLLWDCSSPHG